MRKLNTVLFLWVIFCLASCDQKQVQIPVEATQQLDVFINNVKFSEDPKFRYPGVVDPTLKRDLAEKINLSAEGFRLLVDQEVMDTKIYRDSIKTGIERFASLELEEVHKFRICHYFEEMMDIVGLSSSGEHLNRYVYGPYYSERFRSPFFAPVGPRFR